MMHHGIATKKYLIGHLKKAFFLSNSYLNEHVVGHTVQLFVLQNLLLV